MTLPTGEGAIGLTYDNGHVHSMSGPPNEVVTFGRNGILPTSMTWTGDVAGSVSWTYDDDFRPATESVNSGASVAMLDASDGLPTCIGGCRLVNDAVMRTGAVLEIDRDDAARKVTTELGHFSPPAAPPSAAVATTRAWSRTGADCAPCSRRTLPRTQVIAPVACASRSVPLALLQAQQGAPGRSDRRRCRAAQPPAPDFAACSDPRNAPSQAPGRAQPHARMQPPSLGKRRLRFRAVGIRDARGSTPPVETDGDHMAFATNFKPAFAGYRRETDGTAVASPKGFARRRTALR